MRLEQTYKGAEAQRFALEPAPYGVDWPEVALEAEENCVYEKEDSEPGAHFFLLLACDTEGNEAGRKRIGARREWVSDGSV